MNTIDWLCKLISFNTVSHQSNLPLIYEIQDYLMKYNISSFLTYDQSKQKANLFATLGEGTDKGLILSGHTDVVPVEGQAWKSDPFKAEIIDDKIVGRGSTDMKGFIAVVLALLPQLLALKLKKPLHLAFSYDEEIGCLGAPQLIKGFQSQNIHPSACIVGEPTGCRPIVAHKGIQVYRCRLHGKSAHSSLTPEACNAVEFAAELICWLSQFANELKTALFFDDKFDVPYTTLTTNIVHGGTAGNIIPNTCELMFEFRNLPQVSPSIIHEKINHYIEDILLPKMRKTFDKADITYEEIAKVPGFEVAKDSIMMELAKISFNDSDFNKVSYATEAGLFEQAGISTLICGPGFITEAHKPNEYILLSELKTYEFTLLQLIEKYQNIVN